MTHLHCSNYLLKLQCNVKPLKTNKCFSVQKTAEQNLMECFKLLKWSTFHKLEHFRAFLMICFDCCLVLDFNFEYSQYMLNVDCLMERLAFIAQHRISDTRSFMKLQWARAYYFSENIANTIFSIKPSAPSLAWIWSWQCWLCQSFCSWYLLLGRKRGNTIWSSHWPAIEETSAGVWRDISVDLCSWETIKSALPLIANEPVFHVMLGEFCGL